jgi:hypothetical protein
MYTREQIEQHIWDYIDGLSTPQEKAMVEKFMQTDPAWKNLYDELNSLNLSIQSTDMMEEPSMRFTRNVMDEVSRFKVAPPAQSYINKKIIYGIAAFFILSVVGMLGYLFTSFDFSSSTGGAPLFDTKSLELDTSKYLNSTVLNIFVFMDVIAGLLLLDRYLTRRKTANS